MGEHRLVVAELRCNRAGPPNTSDHHAGHVVAVFLSDAARKEWRQKIIALDTIVERIDQAPNPGGAAGPVGTTWASRRQTFDLITRLLLDGEGVAVGVPEPGDPAVIQHVDSFPIALQLGSSYCSNDTPTASSSSTTRSRSATYQVATVPTVLRRARGRSVDVQGRPGPARVDAGPVGLTRPLAEAELFLVEPTGGAPCRIQRLTRSLGRSSDSSHSLHWKSTRPLVSFRPSQSPETHRAGLSPFSGLATSLSSAGAARLGAEYLRVDPPSNISERMCPGAVA